MSPRTSPRSPPSETRSWLARLANTKVDTLTLTADYSGGDTVLSHEASIVHPPFPSYLLVCVLLLGSSPHLMSQYNLE